MLVRQGRVVREKYENGVIRAYHVAAPGAAAEGGAKPTHLVRAMAVNSTSGVQYVWMALLLAPDQSGGVMPAKDTKGRTVGGAIGSNTGAPAPYSSWPAVDADVPEGADSGGGDHWDH